MSQVSRYVTSLQCIRIRKDYCICKDASHFIEEADACRKFRDTSHLYNAYAFVKTSSLHFSPTYMLILSEVQGRAVADPKKRHCKSVNSSCLCRFERCMRGRLGTSLGKFERLWTGIQSR